ncbi:DnaJ C-terminal domain-containing protein [Roseisalinus antarcticus]|uniref:Curved DNA-binding protein n=1 Tax=Roseisalinus antarcticus TaxID=254357 RepID=A0A1Y5SEM6_9RHOB|nr:DnaJ C-terminal domain-containing protein [Roseisalinus antarcticus]SLN37418.1 Curved DNA-binding protein [Roseisalinus antarcticus]
MADDPYKALGLTSAATTAEIKKAYRKLVRESHPDLHPDDPGAAGRFKTIAAAYELLKDPETRRRFDAGEIDASGAERPPRQYYRDFADATGNPYAQGRGFSQEVDPEDIFSEFLRGRGRGRGFSAPGADQRYTLEVDFLDAVRGSETRITLPDGKGLAVRIPAGTADGQTLRLRGKGGPGTGGAPAGDALIALTVRPHPVFRREGDDILVTLPITIDEAILGGKVSTPTIDGPVGLTIPAGASSGRVLRLRGRGVPASGKRAAGDQRVELKITAPPEIDAELRAFMETWRERHGYDPRGDLLKRGAK